MKKGMNPESVDLMGQQIQEAGDNVKQVFEKAAARVEEFDWTGEDRDEYVTQFADQLGQLAAQVLQQCTDFADRASKNAAAQRDASS